MQFSSYPASTQKDRYARIMASDLGFIMAPSSPACSAMRKKAQVTFSRWGRPKDTLDTPRDTATPSSFLMRDNASRVTFAASCPALTAMVKGSMIMSFLEIP